jgi:hypothetical protein
LPFQRTNSHERPAKTTRAEDRPSIAEDHPLAEANRGHHEYEEANIKYQSNHRR